MPSGELQELPEKSKTLRKRQVWIATFSTLVALMGAVSAGVSARFFVEKPQPTFRDIETLRAVESTDKKVAVLQQQMQQMEGLINKLQATNPKSREEAKITADVKALSEKVDGLNDAVGQTPEKALALPLMKKDLDNLKDSYRRDLDNIQAEVNRVYDQNKWFIGLMFTMALGLIGLAVSNLLQLRKS